MLTQLLINTLTGAGTGYITNNIAIKMLFKKYFGRFGGMIEDTHEEFVENISALIEKDLINHTTLADEFQSHEFGEYIQKLVRDMFTKSLLTHSQDLHCIEGIYTTRDNLLEFLKSHKDERKAIKHQLTAKSLKEALSFEQLTHISHSVTKVVVENKHTYIDILLPLLKVFKLENLLSEELFAQLLENLKDIIFTLEFQKFDTDIDDTLEKLFDSIDLEEMLLLVKEGLENIYLKQFFTHQEESIKNILDTFISIALTDAGQNAINESVRAILENIKTVESSLLDFLDEDITAALKLFIQTELPQLIEQIITFIDKNEEELELLINTSIDDALSDGIFAPVKQKFVSIFYTNIVQDFGILQQVKSFMHEHQELAQEEIIKQLLDILENKSIGELYTFVSEKKIITAEKITDLVMDNLKKLQTDKQFKLIDVALQKQLKEYTKVDINLIKNEIIPTGIEKIKKEYLYAPTLQQHIVQETHSHITQLKEKTVHDILGSRLDAITQKILHFIDETSILDILLRTTENILDKPIHNTIDMQDIDLNYEKYINEFISKQSIKEVIIHLQSEEVYEAVEHLLIKVIVENLEDILQGNVSEAVKSELTKLPPSQIKDMVEEFMGEELKPINYFGAFLGGITGAGIGAASVSVYANPMLYGIVGVATNYLAIKMLFQPYTPLKIGKFKIPLSQGVLPANKAKMALKMSDFVDEFMLNGTSIEDFFANNSEYLKKFISQQLSKDNYAIVDKLLHQDSNTSEISHQAISLLFNFLEKNEVKIAEKVFSLALSYYDNAQEYKAFVTTFMLNKAMKMDLSPFLYAQFEHFVNQENSLQFLSADIEKEFRLLRDAKFDEFLAILSKEEQLHKVITYIEPHFQSFIQKNTLNSILGIKIKDALGKHANTALINIFYGHGSINELLNFFTKGEFGEHTQLSDMINGMLPEIIERNLNRIIEEVVLPTLRENKKVIRKEILKKVPFGAGWVVKRDIDKTIDIILDEKVPHFIEEKLAEINHIIQNFLNTKIINLGYQDNIIKQQKVDDLIRSILSSKNFDTALQKSMSVFIEHLFSMQLAEILKLFHVESLLDIYTLFQAPLQQILQTLFKNISTEKQAIFQTLNTLFFEKIVPDILKHTKIKALLKNVDRAMLMQEFVYLQNNLCSSPAFEQALKKLLDSFMGLFLEEKFVDIKVLQEDLEHFLQAVIQDKEALRNVLVPFLTKFLQNLNAMLDTRFKDHSLQIIIDAAFESIQNNIAELINAVDFKKVITKEIEAMHPKELEDMFYSFAGKYFNKLILYGSLGFFFGLFTLIEL